MDKQQHEQGWAVPTTTTGYTPINQQQVQYPADIYPPTLTIPEHDKIYPVDPEGQQQPEPSNRKKRIFSVLVILSVCINALLMFLWLLLISETSFPWWIYPLGACSTTLCIVYVCFFVPNKKFLLCHAAIFLNLNAIIVLTYIFKFTTYPWFVHILAPTAGALVLHYILDKHFSLPSEARLSLGKILLHAYTFAFFVPFNIMMFITWTATSPHSPWVLFPFFGTSIPLSILYVIGHYKDNPHAWFIGHTLCTSQINLLMLFSWSIGGAGFPWFIFPIAIFSAILLAHYLLHFHRTRLTPHLVRFEKATGIPAQAISNKWANDENAACTSSTTCDTDVTQTELIHVSSTQVREKELEKETGLFVNGYGSVSHAQV